MLVLESSGGGKRQGRWEPKADAGFSKKCNNAGRERKCCKDANKMQTMPERECHEQGERSEARTTGRIG